nr:8126_t:CDS:2 [Entrophospora candida]
MSGVRHDKVKPNISGNQTLSLYLNPDISPPTYVNSLIDNTSLPKAKDYELFLIHLIHERFMPLSFLHVNGLSSQDIWNVYKLEFDVTRKDDLSSKNKNDREIYYNFVRSGDVKLVKAKKLCASNFDIKLRENFKDKINKTLSQREDTEWMINVNGKRYDIVKMTCKSFEKTNVFRLNYNEPILSYIIDFTESNPIEDIEENVLHELTKLPKDLYQEFDVSSITYLSYLYQDRDKVEESEQSSEASRLRKKKLIEKEKKLRQQQQEQEEIFFSYEMKKTWEKG